MVPGLGAPGIMWQATQLPLARSLATALPASISPDRGIRSAGWTGGRQEDATEHRRNAGGALANLQNHRVTSVGGTDCLGVTGSGDAPRVSFLVRA